MKTQKKKQRTKKQAQKRMRKRQGRVQRLAQRDKDTEYKKAKLALEHAYTPVDLNLTQLGPAHPMTRQAMHHFQNALQAYADLARKAPAEIVYLLPVNQKEVLEQANPKTNPSGCAMDGDTITFSPEPGTTCNGTVVQEFKNGKVKVEYYNANAHADRKRTIERKAILSITNI